MMIQIEINQQGDPDVCELPPVQVLDIKSFLATISKMLEKHGVNVRVYYKFGNIVGFKFESNVIQKDIKNNVGTLQ